RCQAILECAAVETRSPDVSGNSAHEWSSGPPRRDDADETGERRSRVDEIAELVRRCRQHMIADHWRGLVEREVLLDILRAAANRQQTGTGPETMIAVSVESS